MAFKLELRECPRSVSGDHVGFDVMLNGKRVDQAHWNIIGYRVGLPCPDGGRLDPGEISLARLRREVGKLNAEGKKADRRST